MNLRRRARPLVTVAVFAVAAIGCSDAAPSAEPSDSAGSVAVATTAASRAPSATVAKTTDSVVTTNGPSATTAPDDDAGDPIAGVLPPERVTTWNPGVSYGGGGIPEHTEICAELSPSGGDDTAAIQAALEACPADHVVQLSAGTFEINGAGLAHRRSGVTLRGSGPRTPGTGEGGTRLVKADRETNPNAAVLYVGNNPQEFAESVDLATDAVKGTSTITLTSDPGLAVGEYVLVDHVTNDDPDVVWGAFHDGPGGGSRRWFDRQDRSLSQIVEIVAVDGATITLATPLHWTFRTEFAAQLTRYGEWTGGPVRPFVESAGVEDLYVYGGMGGDYHGNVAVSACAYCWVRNIESDFAEGTSVGLYGTYRSEIRDSYIHSSSNPNPGGGGYLTGISNGGSDNLVENNVIWNGNKMVAMRASGGGNVVAYNYMEDGYGSGYKQIVEIGLNATHYTTPHMELLEGNQAFNLDGDSYWGNTIDITVFRNHFTGTRRNIGGLGLSDLQNRRVIALNHFQYRYNFVANVLGTDDMKLVPGQQEFVYESSGNLDEPVVPMWQLGYVGEDPGQPFDPKVAETAIRHGNYDHVTGEVAWDESLPQQLPPSMYLTAKPAFFGDLPWPWVTPEDPQERIATLPARQRFDAMAPQEADPVSASADEAEGGEGMARIEIDGPGGAQTSEASFVFDEFAQESDGRVHMVWANADGARLVLELTKPSTGTMTSTGTDPFLLDLTTQDGDQMGSKHTSCDLTIDTVSESSIAGGFVCEPTADGTSATGTFEATAS